MSCLPEQSPEPLDHTAVAVELIEQSRNAVMDCRTDPVTDVIAQLSEFDAKRLLLAVALIAGTLAIQLPDTTRAVVLAAYRKDTK